MSDDEYGPTAVPSRTRKGSDEDDEPERYSVTISKSSAKRRGQLTTTACLACRRAKVRRTAALSDEADPPAQAKCIRSDPDAARCDRCARINADCVAGEPRRAPRMISTIPREPASGPPSVHTPTSDPSYAIGAQTGQELLAGRARPGSELTTRRPLSATSAITLVSNGR